jgi:uncharacterized protein
VKAIADTGFLLAFANRKDQHHAWAIKLAERVTEPPLTCDAVLAEAAFHLGSSAIALAFVTQGLVRPVLVLGDHIARLADLAQRYAHREPDLADLCLIPHSPASLRGLRTPTSRAATVLCPAADADPSQSTSLRP